MKSKFRGAKLITLILFLTGAKADLPVHCISKDEPSTEKLQGTWYFHVSQQSSEVNLFHTQEVCTHQLPNKVQAIGQDYQFSFSEEDIWKVIVLPN